MTLVVAAAILAWPRVIDRYRAPAGGWQITTVPWQAALGIIPSETWLTRRYSGYRLAESINRHVPAGQKLWSTIPLAEAYIEPDVLVNYYSAESEAIQDILLTPVTDAMQPLWNLRFTFAPRQLSHLRIVQTGASPDEIWSVGEARFFRQQNEVNPVAAGARSQSCHALALVGAHSCRHDARFRFQDAHRTGLRGTLLLARSGRD
jgi:hypothetical protein